MNERPGILFIGCWSLREPQCQRLNLDSLRRLARDGDRVHLITWERPPYAGTADERRRWRASLRGEGIEWYPLSYHRRPLLAGKIIDGLAGVVAGWRVLRRERIRVIHARSEFPAVVGSILARLARIPLLYESDAPISEERVDVGLWTRTDLAYRIARAFERALPQAAEEMIVLSERYAARLRGDGVTVPITVLPCCTDTDRFRRDADVRRRLREEHGWGDRLVIVYSGQTRGWYLFDEMAAFFASLYARHPRAHFLCLINQDGAAARDLALRQGVPEHALTVRSVPADAVPAWLSASDIALSFIRAGTSKFASSPTKMAEYLACGLPVLITPGIGDTEALVADPHAGHVVRAFDETAIAAAVAWVEWVVRRLPEAAARCRHLAVERLSLCDIAVPTYAAAYRRLAGGRPLLPELRT